MTAPDRTRTVTWKDPWIVVDAAKTLSGIDRLRAVMRGDVPGGLACTMLDSALGCAVTSTLPAGGSCATTDLHVRFIRPITLESGKLRCEATTIHVGKT